MRAQEQSAGQKKRVLHLARRMIGGKFRAPKLWKSSSTS